MVKRLSIFPVLSALDESGGIWKCASATGLADQPFFTAGLFLHASCLTGATTRMTNRSFRGTGSLSTALAGLAKAFPTVAWFSIVQIALLCLSCWMIFKSVMQCFRQIAAGRCGWGRPGAPALAAVFLEICTRITFHPHGGCLCAPLRWRRSFPILILEKSGFRQTALGVMGALPPTAFAYALRKGNAVAGAAFSAVALFWVWLLQAQEGRRERRKALLIASGACVLVIAGLMGWRAVEIKLRPGRLPGMAGRAHPSGGLL